ncbi:hypothetical protein F8568_027875 [Actinomadura sp. LD22]|uniref:Uncharacterized protein n=1 Tax=Actinomadura physcomitrii TaxID=2650748 RepID=A0A6I4MEI2_9ACTN|nr:hypothetical protein [Actinomadura physcomitrii]MWA04132.1 hypothetical protein [Actinomadura physcomitrii]
MTWTVLENTGPWELGEGLRAPGPADGRVLTTAATAGGHPVVPFRLGRRTVDVR